MAAAGPVCSVYVGTACVNLPVPSPFIIRRRTFIRGKSKIPRRLVEPWAQVSKGRRRTSLVGAAMEPFCGGSLGKGQLGLRGTYTERLFSLLL